MKKWFCFFLTLCLCIVFCGWALATEDRLSDGVIGGDPTPQENNDSGNLSNNSSGNTGDSGNSGVSGISGSSGSGFSGHLPDGNIIEDPNETTAFSDVTPTDYFSAPVAWAVKKGITNGVDATHFAPTSPCNRGQMVTFLWRAAGCPEPTGTASGFSDVAAGSWYEKAVAWAVENGITTGVGGGRFGPNGIVNRAQAVTFLYRAAGAPETTASESFTDVGSGEFYTDAVAWAVASGVTNGVGDNAFAPNANCVRGQTVTFLYRAYK